MSDEYELEEPDEEEVSVQVQGLPDNTVALTLLTAILNFLTSENNLKRRE